MDTNQSLNSQMRAFYSDGFKLGMKVFDSGFNKESLFSAINEMHEIINELTDSISVFAKRQGINIDCKKGCYWCCHQPVFALDYELDYLKSFIKKNFTSEQEKDLIEKAKLKNTHLSKLRNEELLNSKFPCPLLENGACSAYEARPVACRIYLSTNLTSCQIFYNKPENENNFPALLDFPMKAGRMINEGFKAALKSNGINTEEFRIEEKLLD
ncbi:MAG: YkgJ family cysteine cluster protein [Draconibacterium sp.]